MLAAACRYARAAQLDQQRAFWDFCLMRLLPECCLPPTIGNRFVAANLTVKFFKSGSSPRGWGGWIALLNAAPPIGPLIMMSSGEEICSAWCTLVPVAVLGWVCWELDTGKAMLLVFFDDANLCPLRLCRGFRRPRSLLRLQTARWRSGGWCVSTFMMICVSSSWETVALVFRRIRIEALDFALSDHGRIVLQATTVGCALCVSRIMLSAIWLFRRWGWSRRWRFQGGSVRCLPARTSSAPHRTDCAKPDSFQPIIGFLSAEECQTHFGIWLWLWPSLYRRLNHRNSRKRFSDSRWWNNLGCRLKIGQLDSVMLGRAATLPIAVSVHR